MSGGVPCRAAAIAPRGRELSPLNGLQVQGRAGCSDCASLHGNPRRHSIAFIGAPGPIGETSIRLTSPARVESSVVSGVVRA